jgi:hypothetical protein
MPDRGLNESFVRRVPASHWHARVQRRSVLGMSTERVAVVPECEECEARWLSADPDRWRLVLVDEELAFYCAACAEREFEDE